MKKEFVNENHKNHYKLWMWLAKNPDKYKMNWPGWKRHNGVYRKYHCCFACSSTGRTDSSCCHRCPLDWETHKSDSLRVPCQRPNSLFALWECEQNLEKRTIMAEIIACKEWIIK